MKNVKDFYPLSPMQQGMLFHSLYAPDSGMYVEQLNCTLQGDLNIAAFESAWQRVVDRHPILQTAFVWEGLKEPIQVVQRQVTLPIGQQDWRGLSSSEQTARLGAFLKAERERGFDLSQAPLMRLALIRIARDAYCLVWTHHHILLDGWSLPLLLREVFALYEAYQRGQEPPLARPRSFRDYIVWLRKQDLSQAKVFWQQTLKGFSAPTPLTVDRGLGNALAQEAGFSELEIHLPVATTDALQSLARQQQVTLNTLVQGAWALLLSRYSGEQDVVFGATVSGRPAELQGAGSMIGLFINTLPVRVRVSPETPVANWLKELHAFQAELRQYEYSPLMQIQAWSDVPRGAPLFESILVFENFPMDAAVSEQKGSLEIKDVHSASHTNYPLTLVALPDREMLLKISYDMQLFDAATIERMMGHLQNLLQGMAADPERLLAALPLVTQEERRQLLFGWNDLTARYPQDRCIHQWVQAQVGQRPDAVALAFEDERLTYAELNRQTNQLAHYLQKLGVGPEVLVGLYVERSPQMVIGILGILKAGGAYLPLDPAYPAERLAFIVEDAQAPVLLTQRHMVEALPQHHAHVVCLDTDWPTIAQESAENPANGASPASLAYVIYTSGSTGKPKGTLVTHANVVRLFEATYDWYQFDETDVWTLFHSCAFDFSVWELWGALFYGGCVRVVPFWASRSPEIFYQLLCEEQVTVLNQTPSAFRQLARAEEVVGLSRDLALRYVIFGGEALELQSLKPWFDRHGDHKPQLVNMYGITETTVHVTYRPLRMSDVLAAAGSVIGAPIPDLQVYILDQTLEPVPIGVPGEVCVGGAGVARGYLNRPELTAQRFIRDPFSDRPETRLYKSGDLARYLPGGDIEYLGRIDQQVKIYGFRVELGEIETVLVQHPGVREAVILLRQDEPDHKRLVAYVVPAQEPAPAFNELQRFLSEKLPDYMLPSAFVMLEKLPLTTHGKIDHRALPAPDQARPELETAYVAPTTPEEKKLAEVWKQVLGVERVGVHDDFFELGGDSILSIQMIARAKQAGLELTPRHVFEQPTIKALAALAGAVGVIQAEQGIVLGPVPLTPVQSWFFEHHPVAPEHFNTSMLLKIWQGLDFTLLERTIRYLLSHHDALRLEFQKVGSVWQQVSADVQEKAPVCYIDLSALAWEEQPGAVESVAAALQAAFNLSKGPLLHVVYFDLGAGQAGRLLVIFHHLVTDGVSWRIFIQDFETVYRQLSLGEPVRLPPKTTSFWQWAQRLYEYAQTPQLGRELDYWKEIAAGSIPQLPLDYPGGVNTYGSTDSVTLSLDVDETRALLQKVPAAYGTRINEVLLAVLVRALSRWTGKRRLLVEMEGHGREDILEGVDLSRTLGWFTSIFPLLLDLEDASGLAEELQTIKEQLRGVPNRGIGYGLLRYLCDDGPTRERLSALPEPEINFNYLGQFDQMPTPEWVPFQVASESVGPEQNPDSTRSASLYVVGIVSGGELGVRWLYSRNLHERATIERLAQGFMDELRELVAYCLASEVVEGFAD